MNPSEPIESLISNLSAELAAMKITARDVLEMPEQHIDDIVENPDLHTNNIVGFVAKMAAVAVRIRDLQIELEDQAPETDIKVTYKMISRHIGDWPSQSQYTFQRMLERKQFAQANALLRSGLAIDKSIVTSIILHEPLINGTFPMLRYILDSRALSLCYNFGPRSFYNLMQFISSLEIRKLAAISSDKCKLAIMKWNLIRDLHFSSENSFNFKHTVENQHPTSLCDRARLDFASTHDVDFMLHVYGLNGQFPKCSDICYPRDDDKQMIYLDMSKISLIGAGCHPNWTQKTNITDEFKMIRNVIQAPKAYAMMLELCKCEPKVVEYLMKLELSVNERCNPPEPLFVSIIPTRDTITSPLKMSVHMYIARALNNVALVNWFASKQLV